MYLAIGFHELLMTYLNIKESPDPIPEPLPLVTGCPDPASVVQLQGLLQAAQVAA